MVAEDRARAVRILFLDVDGVLTDGAMYYGDAGEALKRFHTRDGLGIRLLREAGVRVVLVTSEDSAIVLRRAEKLGLTEVHLGVQRKGVEVDRVLAEAGLSPEAAAYVGDDVNDCEALCRVGLAVAVADAEEPVKGAAHYVTRRPGGHGAVREVCDLILKAQGLAPWRAAGAGEARP